MLKMFFLTFLFTSVLAIPKAQALDETHSQVVCAANNSQICAHLGFLTALNTQTEAKFYAHITAPQGQEVKDLKVSLWMEMAGHGHGAAPVDVTSVEFNKYKVENAWFVMAGTWQVQLRFQIGSEAYLISIPVSVSP